MLRVNEVGGKLIEAVKCFYVDSRTCVRVGIDGSTCFPLISVNVGLRQGFGMSPYGCLIFIWIMVVWCEMLIL